MGLFDRIVVRTLPVVPRAVVQRISSRYIAGPTLADARRTVAALNATGKSATIDVLGEEITHPAEANAIADAYHDVAAAIEDDGLDANLSVKLTGLGLNLSYDLAKGNLREVVDDAGARGRFVRIDMEDSSVTDDTLRLYRELREDGVENVGIVLQAYLRRTMADIEALADLRPRVRLCKGIYVEPPAVAFQEYEAVRASFVRALDALLERGCHVGIATHDEWLIRESLERVARLEPDEYEFQMLLGVRETRADELVAAGHRLRVYVPFGTHWYEYSLRRLAENPRMAGMIAGDVVRGLVPGRSR